MAYIKECLPILLFCAAVPPLDQFLYLVYLGFFKLLVYFGLQLTLSKLPEKSFYFYAFHYAQILLIFNIFKAFPFFGFLSCLLILVPHSFFCSIRWLLFLFPFIFFSSSNDTFNYFLISNLLVW